MKAQLKLGGRPPMADGKRSKKIDVRFTEEEYRMILLWEETLGINKTDLIRGRVLQKTKEVIVNAKALIEEIDAIGTELGRCGNNINQLARHANTLNKAGRLNPSVINEFNRLFTDYLKRIETLETTFRKLIRIAR
ncbi:plasmid mobilization protein [Mucilaginibacter rubeus]|nr:plasmid mobilization relaxosome protein MobC [Mucilaginibacter rubeus]